MSLCGEDLQQEVVIPAGLFSHAPDGLFALGLIEQMALLSKFQRLRTWRQLLQC